MTRRTQRRRFLQASAAAGATSFFVNPLAAGQGRVERVRLGIVGVNGKGGSNLAEIEKTGLAEIVALCDVDANRAAAVRQRFPQARFYDDYRGMMDQKDLQAVVVSTPDHHHAFAALPALRARKHVYCEKPLAHSVHEVRLMMETAAREKVVTQMGTQIHAGNNYRRVVEIVQAGALGPINRVKVWCNTQLQPGFRVKERQDPPRGLNYDLWLGPAPERAYPPFRTGNNAPSVHFHWRWWWDFGGGVLADMGCHFMDLPHWALRLGAPATVAANGRVVHKGDNPVPDLLQAEYEYPARDNLPAVHLTWYHGVSGPDLAGKITHAGFSSGVLFEGAKGSLVADYSHYRLLPEGRFRDFVAPKPTLARSIGHHREWVEAIRRGGTTTCNFAYSGLVSEAVLLGNVAYRSGARIHWDGTTGRVTNNDKAAQFLRRAYRPGWTL